MIFAGILAVFSIAIYFGGRPVWKALKSYRAQQWAHESQAALAGNRVQEALTKANGALRFAPREPAALRAMAAVLARCELHAETLGFLRALEGLGALSGEDLRLFIASAMRTGEIRDAVAHLKKLKALSVPPTRVDRLLSAQIAGLEGVVGRAVAEARELLTDAATPDALRSSAALLLIAAPDPEVRRAGTAEVQRLSSGSDETGIQALTWLGRNELFRQGPEATGAELERIAAALEAHPLATLDHRLLSREVLLQARPEDRTSILDETFQTLRIQKDQEELARVVQWFVRMGEPTLAGSLLPKREDIRSPKLHLARVDVLAASGKWDVVRNVLMRDEFPLEPRLRACYLAQALGHLGQGDASANRWEEAYEAAGVEVANVLEVARSADLSGAHAPAGEGFVRAARMAPKNRAVQDEALRYLVRQGTTREVLNQLRKMLEQRPDDLPLLNDEAYLSALCNVNPQKALVVAERLLEGNPWSPLVRATTALARLRVGRPTEALALYTKLENPTDGLTPSGATVYASVLYANGFREEAARIASFVLPSELRPEERALLAEVTQ